MKQRMICSFLALAMLCTTIFTGAVYADKEDEIDIVEENVEEVVEEKTGEKLIEIFVDGEELTFDEGQTPMILNDRTMVPLRAVSEALNSTVYWLQDDLRIQIIKYDKVLSMQLNSPTLEIYSILNGEVKIAKSVSLEAPPIQADETHGYRTYVPIRVIAENFGADVNWNYDENNNMIINIISHEDNSNINSIFVSDLAVMPDNTLFSVTGRIIVIGNQYFLQDIQDELCYIELTQIPQVADFWTQQLGVLSNNPHGQYVTITGLKGTTEAGYPTIPLKRSVTGIRLLK